MASSGMLHHAALVRTNVSEELTASFIRVTRIGELGTTLTVTSNQYLVFLRSVRRLHISGNEAMMIFNGGYLKLSIDLHLLLNKECRLLECYAVWLLLDPAFSEERSAPIIRVTRIGELETTLAVRS
jgi:hypothetical protein